MSKCYFVLRENLEYSSDRLFSLAVKTIPSLALEYPEWSQSPDSEIYMMWNVNFLYSLEHKLLTDGIIFRWIEEQNELIGIIIEPTDQDIRTEYLSDCMSLDAFAKHRLKMFNELANPPADLN